MMDEKKKYFYKEVQILRDMKHNNVVHYHEYVKTVNNHYLFMEYCEGGGLNNYLEKHPDLSSKERKKLVKQIIDGFVYFAKKGVKHRDIKLENILLKGGNAKFADFGFSTDEDLFKTRLEIPDYVPYEIIVGLPYTEKCDIWSLGVTLFKLMFGKHPIEKFNQAPDMSFNKRAKAIKEFRLQKVCEDLVLQQLLEGMLQPLERERFDYKQVEKLCNKWFEDDKDFELEAEPPARKLDSLGVPNKDVDIGVTVNQSNIQDTYTENTNDNRSNKELLESELLEFFKRKYNFTNLISETMQIFSFLFKNGKLNRIICNFYVYFQIHSVCLIHFEAKTVSKMLESDEAPCSGISDFQTIKRKKEFLEMLENAKSRIKLSENLFKDLVSKLEVKAKHGGKIENEELKKMKQTNQFLINQAEENKKIFIETSVHIIKNYQMYKNELDSQLIKLFLYIVFVIKEMCDLENFDQEKKYAADTRLNIKKRLVGFSKEENIEWVYKELENIISRLSF